MKQHDGFIKLYSEVDRGTTFRICFPDNCGQPEREAAEIVARAVTGTETILVADDNGALRDLAKEILSSRGYKLILVKDGAEAVRLFRENPETIGLVLLDVIMPKLSGPEAFAQMAALRPNLPCIFTTGDAIQAASLNANFQAGDAFLQKPYAPPGPGRVCSHRARQQENELTRSNPLLDETRQHLLRPSPRVPNPHRWIDTLEP